MLWIDDAAFSSSQLMFIFIIYTGWKNKVTTKQGLRNSEDPLSEFRYYNDKWDKKGWARSGYFRQNNTAIFFLTAGGV